MNDFDKFREAAEEIKLDDLQKQRILEACKGRKRRKINYTAVAGIAAVLVISFAVFSPGFLMRAGMADKAANEAVPENYYAADQDVAEEDVLLYDEVYSQYSASGGNGDGKYTYTVDECTQIIFDAEEFRSIYSLIPQSFINLVDLTEFNEWAENATVDNGMAIVQFKECFGIAEEDFEKANREYAKYIYEIYGALPLYFTSDAENEKYEIFNTELIYGADKEAIDEYYRAFAEFPEGVVHSSPAEIIVPEEYYK